MGTTKKQVLDVIKELPEQVDLDEIIERLYLLRRIQRGLEQKRAARDTRDRDLLDQNADRLNAEMADAQRSAGLLAAR